MKKNDRAPTLMEILEELTIHCSVVTGEKSEIHLVLPKKVIESFSTPLNPIEKIKTKGKKNHLFVPTMHGTGGTIKLYNNKDNEVTIKE